MTQLGVETCAVSSLVRLGSVYGGWWVLSGLLSASYVNRIVFSKTRLNRVVE